MSVDYDLLPDEEFGIEDGEPFPFAMVPDWVMLHPDVTSRDVHIYGLLRAHVVHARCNNEAWPSQEKLAAVLGLSKADEISKSIGRLERIGALRKKIRTGRKGRYTVYVLEPRPPQSLGYDGLRSVWELHRPGTIERLITERVKRLPHRKKTASAPKNRSSDDITPDQGGAPEQVTPNRGAPPDQGLRDTPDQGGKPEVGDPDVTTEPPTPAADVGEPLPPEPTDDEWPGGPEPDDPHADPVAAAQVTATRRADKRRRSPAGLNATAHTAGARRLVEAYASTCSMRPVQEVFTALAVQVDSMLRQSVPEAVIAQGLAEWGAKGFHPSALPSFVTAAANRKPEQHLAPSDARFVRLQQLKEAATGVPAGVFKSSLFARRDDGPPAIEPRVLDGEVVGS